MKITLKDIANVPLLQPFKDFPWKLSALMQKARIVSYTDQQIIIREGDKDEGALFVVLHGAVIIAKVIDPESGRSKPLARLREGEFFGEMSLFDNSPRSATVLSHGDTILLEVSKSAFEELVKSDVEVSSALLYGVIQAVSSRLRKTNMELVVLYDTGKIISRSQRLGEMCQAILSRLCGSLAVSHGCIMIFNELSDSYDRVAQLQDFILEPMQLHWALDQLRRHPSGFRHPEEPSLEESVVLPKPFLLVTPLTRKGAVYGAVALGREDRPFTDAEFNLVASVSNQASFAVENARNREDEAAREAYKKRRQRA